MPFAFLKPLRNCRPSRYQRGLVGETLRKISVILLHNVERCLLGEPAMVLGKESVHLGKLFVGHSHLQDFIPYRKTALGRASFQAASKLPSSWSRHQKPSCPYWGNRPRYSAAAIA